MITLLRTYLDIIALRKGPDSLPASWLMLALSLVLLGLAWIIQLSLMSAPAIGVIAALTAYTTALAFYAAVAFLSGFSSRLLQMLSAIIACGSLISILSTASSILLAPLFGAALANSVSVLVFFWSVPVKGHIVARTLHKHWFFGVAIAMVAFVLRFGVESSLIIRQQGVGV